MAVVISAVVFLAACAVNNPLKDDSLQSGSSAKSDENGITDKPANEDINNKPDSNTEVNTDDNNNIAGSQSGESAGSENGHNSNQNTGKDLSDKGVTHSNGNGKIDEAPKKHITAGSNEVDVLTNRDSALEQQWEIVDNVAKAGQSYYNDYFSKTRIITKNGYLYNMASGDIIDTYYLVENGYLSSKYVNSQCELLLLLSEDVKKFNGVKLGGAQRGLTVFAVLKNPDDSTYLLAPSSGSGGVITQAQYNEILSKYNQKHGSVSRLYSDSGEYNRIVNFINMYEGKYDSYYVRNITVDSKYAMVILSPQSDIGAVKQYILKKSNGIWEVVYDGLEKEPRLAMAINKSIPDFNLSIIPDYSVYDYRNSINKYKNDVLILMSQMGIISGSADVEFAGSAGNYCYVVLKNQMKYLALNENERWTFTNVSSNYEAEKIMLESSVSAPLFIIWDR